MKTITVTATPEGKTEVEAHGFPVVAGQCTGEKATAFIEAALGGVVAERQRKRETTTVQQLQQQQRA